MIGVRSIICPGSNCPLHRLIVIRRLLRAQRHSAATVWGKGVQFFSSVSAFSACPSDQELIDHSASAAEDVRHFKVIPRFATSQEEQSILKEASRALRGRKYQYDHWDGAIEGYRETEKLQWEEENRPLVDKLRKLTELAVEGKELKTLEEIHVLDLAPDGEIKPHIDSIKFCGEVIAGVSLLSSSVMKMEHEEDPGKWIHALLPQFSLYIMSGAVRYKYKHSIPKEAGAIFKGERIPRNRRLSIICRTVAL